MRHRLIQFASAMALGAALVPAATAGASAPAPATYSHIFVIVEENHDYGQIIGNPNAPNINSWASTYGSATNYYGTIHPSEGNYVGMVGGNSYGITNDNLWNTNRVNAPNLVDQLEQAGLSWKGYFENLPHPGFTGKFNEGELYAAKHNGFLNFDDINTNQARLNQLVPYSYLSQELAANTVPSFSYIVPNQCNDMHGLSNLCPDDQSNIKVADSWAGQAVNAITSSATWKSGNNAIWVLFDEGNTNLGCCDANPGGGQVVSVVITNHGPRGVTNGTAANHYSFLATIQQVFGLGCTASFNGSTTPVGYTCDSANVKPLTSLFAIRK